MTGNKVSRQRHRAASFTLSTLGVAPAPRAALCNHRPRGCSCGFGAARSDRISSHVDQVARRAFLGFLCHSGSKCSGDVLQRGAPPDSGGAAGVGEEEKKEKKEEKKKDPAGAADQCACVRVGLLLPPTSPQLLAQLPALLQQSLGVTGSGLGGSLPPPAAPQTP